MPDSSHTVAAPWHENLIGWLNGDVDLLDETARAVDRRGGNTNRLKAMGPVEAATELFTLGVPPALIDTCRTATAHTGTKVAADVPHILDLHAQGHTVAQIASEIGTSKPRIYWLFKRRHLQPHRSPGRHPELTVRQREHVMRSWRTGEPMSSIARTVGVSYDQVRYLIKKATLDG